MQHQAAKQQQQHQAASCNVPIMLAYHHFPPWDGAFNFSGTPPLPLTQVSVFRNGENALQVFPALLNVIPEARLNLCIYYLNQGELLQAQETIKGMRLSKMLRPRVCTLSLLLIALSCARVRSLIHMMLSLRRVYTYTCAH